MFDFFQKSLRNKLLLVFIAIGFLPFFILLIYTIYLSETKMVNKIVIEQLDSTELVLKRVSNHLNSLKKEVSFLASLDLMDDLLADDIDKRISRLLSKKSDDFNLDIALMSINNQGVIIASSSKKILSKKFNIENILSSKGSYIIDKNLYIYSKIYASFDTKKELGYLVLEYNLDNLDSYLTHENSVHSYIRNEQNGMSIGEELNLKLELAKTQKTIINSEYVIVYKPIPSLEGDWYIVYAVDKSVALAFLYNFISLMLYISVFIFILIIYISLRYSKDLVKPIEKLTEITNDIAKTQNYSIKLEVVSRDELSILTHSFNKMIHTTSTALSKLEKENKLRVKIFTNLIEVFNTIIQTKSEEECIKTSIDEIKELMPMKDLRFTKDKDITIDGEHIKLYVNDFEHDKKVYFGAIILGIENFEDEYESNFYNSIASMITLQLDMIRLIQSTVTASNAKSAFISNMSHELRTPLNAIIGFSQFMITYEELSDEQMDTVGNIESSAQYLLEMINEILDIAKIEAGKMEVSIQEVDILGIVQSSYKMLSPLANDKNLEFEFIHEEIGNIETDPKMFQQIILNLLSNAIKFTKEGKVTLKLFSDEVKIHISVKDEGAGISAEDMEKLFDDFTQLENIMHKSHKGTGLGLSLSKKMAKLIDGDINLYSEGEGHGTIAVLSINQ